MTTLADRRPRRASTLRTGDFVHSGLVPMRVTGWEDDLVVGVTGRGNRCRVIHPPDRLLDVTRLVDDLTEVDMTGTRLAFIALTATGPAEYHEVWEMSVRLVAPGGRYMESHWQFPVVNLARASGRALKAASFYDRYRRPEVPVDLDVELGTARTTTFEEVARAMARHLVDAHPVCLNPDQELPHLATFLRRHNQPPSWGQVVPLTALAAGRVYGHAHLDPGPPPWDPVRLTTMIVPGLPQPEAVSAPGRLALTVALWDAVTQQRPDLAHAPAQGEPSLNDTLVAN